MTVDGADTPGHPQLFRAVTLEFQRSTEDSATAVRSDGPRHGDVRSGKLREHYFGSHAAYCSYRLPLTLACYRLGQSGDSGVVAKDHHIFYKCYFAALWDSLHVSAPGDFISAIKPKVVFRPTFLPAILFLVEANGWSPRILRSTICWRVAPRGCEPFSWFALRLFVWAVPAAFSG